MDTDGTWTEVPAVSPVRIFSSPGEDRCDTEDHSDAFPFSLWRRPNETPTKSYTIFPPIPSLSILSLSPYGLQPPKTPVKSSMYDDKAFLNLRNRCVARFQTSLAVNVSATTVKSSI